MTVQVELQPAASITRDGITDGRPRSLIPQQHRPRTVLFRGNNSFEAAVFERVVFHMHRQTLVCRIQAGAFWNRPTFQRPGEFQAEVIVQVAGRMLLNNKLPTLLPAPRGRLRCTARLGRLVEVTLSPVLLKPHRRPSALDSASPFGPPRNRRRTTGPLCALPARMRFLSFRGPARLRRRLPLCLDTSL